MLKLALRPNALNIERLKEDEIHEAARVWYEAGIDEYTYLPTFQALTEPKAVVIFTNQIYRECEIWVAKRNGNIAGIAALKGDLLDRLYVHPNHQRQRIGDRLLNHCISIRPKGLRLFTHQENIRARAFYESKGFRAVAFGISPPPESAPDVEYRLGDPDVR